ncbi:MAG: acyl-ACP--UDP-N-acetylglucosamine O-acyltransferase [Kiritimatiellae bacterium]|nr:acyl-ACP--UDP-N-acetylglucosamine O-acyltransferase [Kiritimatiellia bacterium]MDD4341611.1 acyl-ACP--UDP-N-acetylglucosamine O-acyltransferase [Kiritimatiellia bacterium]
METTIHPLAVVQPGAELGERVSVGPFCVVGAQVRLGDGVVLRSHVNVEGNTTLGAGCEVWPFASVGGKTQDLKYKGGAPRLVVGEHTVIRESVTLSCATFADGVTRVGSHCLIMAYCHVAHDCCLGDRVIMANAATLAGHVIVEEDAIIGGLTGVHQFVRIGRMSILGGATKAVKDVPPFMMADGVPLKVYGPNKVGLERHGKTEEVQKALKQAYRIVFRSDLPTAKALERVEAEVPALPEVTLFVDFIRSSERGIAR